MLAERRSAAAEILAPPLSKAYNEIVFLLPRTRWTNPRSRFASSSELIGFSSYPEALHFALGIDR